MVEGPGCTLNGEKIRSRVKQGQRVVELRGSLITQINGSVSCQNGILLLKGKVYTDVKTLGKELFIFFGLTTLRIHFGMHGSVCINSSGRRHKDGAAAVLEIQLTNDLISFFDSTVDVRNTSECEQKLKLLEELDVCSARFSHSRAENELKQHGARMICDVLLDQTVFPGVGNIIKNESMFDSSLHPAVKIWRLSAEQIHHVVKVTHDFTILFYKCRKMGSALYKHYKVYKRSSCGQCNGKITVCRLGENKRMTYFCPCCQKEDPGQINISNLPKRNSLMGWAHAFRHHSNDNVAKKEEEEWTCSLCTLINTPLSKSCNACLTPRPVKETSPKMSDFDTDLIKYPCNSFGKPKIEWKLNRKTAFGTTTLVLTSLRSPGESPEATASVDDEMKRKTPLSHGNASCQALSLIKSSSANAMSWSLKMNGPFNNYANQMASNSIATTSTNQSLFHQPPKRIKTDHNLSFDSQTTDKISVARSAVIMNDDPAVVNPETPRCKKHSRPCALRLVKKEGDNKGRQFYVCSLPRESQCDYFQWADLHFPFCNHGKRCIMRTVLKLGPNNGRNFYVCSQGIGKQCNFFQWAENGPSIRIMPAS
ncbi:endonuclease 8-like 3 isoform X1 [Hemiscyllium ocellatum]|uniref:endonuclease 8-like 3 isoform X1 n=2 Tax=Hemiscyllium ocellatum TaxID=170820 RepID=UPI0029661CDE|nr:endonuclease 8-like 3 isoform X1 [Hemiscyllium ocellatum]